MFDLRPAIARNAPPAPAASFPVPPEEAIRKIAMPSRGHKTPFELITQIVVGVEGSDREFFVQQYAAGLAAMLGARLRAVHVKDAQPADRGSVFRYVGEECRRWGVPFEGRILEGDAAEEIAAEAGPRDLIVLGTRRLPGPDVLGSVARQVMARASAPVLLVRLPA